MKHRETALSRRVGDRDAALRRLRRTTALAVAATAALAATFGGLAAKAFSGHSRKHPTVAASRPTATVRSTGGNAVATPPPLVSAGSAAPAAQPSSPPPAPPAAPPVPTQAPPVAVSGGS